MNHIFRVVFDQVRKTWVVVSELVCAKSKPKSSKLINHSHHYHHAVVLTVASAFLSSVAAAANVVMEGGKIYAGNSAPSQNKIVALNPGETHMDSGSVDSNEIVIIGYDATATGTSNEKAAKSVVIGADAKATDSRVVVIGSGARAHGRQGVAVGQFSGARAQSVAIGADVFAGAYGAIAIGGDDLADSGSAYTDQLPVATITQLYQGLYTGDKPFFENETKFREAYVNSDARKYSPTYAAKLGSIAIGTRAVAGGEVSIALGALAMAMPDYSIAIGARTFVPLQATSGLAIGNTARVFNARGMAVGNFSEAAGVGTSAYGYGAYAIGANSVALGTNVVAAAKVFGGVTIINAYGGNDKNINEMPNAVAGVKTAVANYFSDDAVKNPHRENQVLERGNFGLDTEGDVFISTSTEQVKKSKAQGTKAFALGNYTMALKEGSIGMGMGVLNDAEETINIGAYNYNDGTATYSLILGYNNRHFGGDHNVLIGLNSKITAQNLDEKDLERETQNIMMVANRSVIGWSSDSSVLLGDEIKVMNLSPDSVAIGHGTRVGYRENIDNNGSGVLEAIAIGKQTRVNERANKSIAIGSEALVKGSSDSNRRNGHSSIALGDRATIHQANDAIALGKQAGRGDNKLGVAGDNAIAIGAVTAVNGENAIAIGLSAKSYAAQAIAIGRGSKASGSSSIAIGENNTVSGAQAIAVGKGHTVSGANSGTFGDPNTVSAANAYAIGNDNTINAGANHTFVFGNNITVSQAESVILGHESAVLNNGQASAGATTAYTTTSSIEGLTFGSFAGGTPVGVVSVGATGKERRIQNVAAGLISETSTDAINGSQLFRTNAILGKFATTVKNLMGGNATLNSNTGELTFTNIGNTNKNTIHDAIIAVKEVVQGTANEITVSSSQASTGATTYTVGLDNAIKTQIAAKAVQSDLDTLKANTLKFTANASSTTNTQQLDKTGGLSFAIEGDGTDIVTTASDSKVTIALGQALKNKLDNISGGAADSTAFNNLVNSLGATVDSNTKAVTYPTYTAIPSSGQTTAPTNPKEAINQLITAVNKGMIFSASTGGSVTRQLGETLKITEGAVETGFVAKNLKTGTDTTNHAVLIGMTETPEFKSLDLSPDGTNKIKLTPDDQGQLTLSKEPATAGTGATDDKVVLKGLKDGDSPDSAVTKSALDALKAAAGLDGANGIDGAGADGTPAVGQRGVAGKDVTGADGQTLAGPAGKDGLNGTTLGNKVQALRDGAAGPMVYTDDEGNRLLVENGKYYKPDLVDNMAKANDGKWYDPSQLDDKGNPQPQADGTLPTGQTLAELAMSATDKVVDASHVQLSAVNPDGSTQAPTTLGNLKSALDLPTNSSATAVTAETAKTKVAELLTKQGSPLGSAVTLADLQAVAQAGLDFQGNQADTMTVHRPLGTKLKIEGKRSTTYDDVQNQYSADNLITHKDGDDTIRIEMLKVPTFEALKLKPEGADKPTISLTPSNDGKLSLAKEPVAGGDPNDTKVVLDGLKDGDTSDSAVTKGALDALKADIGLNGANGIDGRAGADGATQVLGQRGVPIQDTATGNNAGQLVGPAGRDGQNGTTLANKVQSLRDGVSGPVVYTDSEGNRLLVENGKYYEPALVGDKVKANDGKWYDPSQVDQNGYPIANPDGTLPQGHTLAELAALPNATGKEVQPADVRMTAVNPDGSTTSPTALGNLKSALGALDTNATSEDQAKDAQNKATKLLAGTDKDDKALDPNQAVTVADLQVLAQAGIDVLGNQDDNFGNRIHVPLGGLLNIKGSDVIYSDANKANYSTENLIAYRDDNGVLRIAFLTKPEFEALKLKANDPNAPTVNFTPNADGNLTLSKDPAAAGTPADDKVVLNGLKDGDTPDSAVTKGALDALKAAAGLDGANGIDGAGADGTPVVGQRGVPGQDTTADGKQLVGPAGKDGLNGTTLGNKVQALRDGAAGPVVYTDAEGNRLLVENGVYYKPALVGDKVKANDGKWYAPNEVDANGNPTTGVTGTTLADLAKVDTDKVVKPKDVRLSAVNPDGSTTNPTALGNLADGKIATGSKDAVTGNQLHQLVEATGATVDKDGNIVAPTIAALNDATGAPSTAPTSVADGLNQAIAKLNEGLTFSDGTTEGKQQLGSKITLTSGNIAGDDTVSGDNVLVKYVKDDTTGDGTWTVAMKKAPTFDSVTVGDPVGNTMVLSGDKIQGKGADGASTSSISLAKGGVSLAGADGSSPVVLSGIAAGQNDNDAVNKKQLDDAVTTMNTNLTDLLGATVEKNPDTGAVTIVNKNPGVGKGIGGTGKTTITEAIAAAKVKVVAGANIEVTEGTDADSGATVYTVETAKDITVESIKVSGKDADGTDKTIEMKLDDEGNLDMGNVRVTGVSEAVLDGDLVTLGQVRGLVGGLESRITDVGKDSDAGTASALAAANLPMVYEAGRNMIAVAGGSYRGQQAIAIGFSSISDTGKTMIRASGTASTRGDYGVGVGIGYQW